MRRRRIPPTGPRCAGSGRPGPSPSTCEAGAPARLEGGRLGGRVSAALGPWRAQGEWWKPGAWALETWHVELAEGGVYQIACSEGSWRVEGMLD
jgi:hypothetical protein